jgi:hypothetical protein
MTDIMVTNAAYSTYSLAFSEADIIDGNLVETFADFKLKVGDLHQLCGSSTNTNHHADKPTNHTDPGG